jgi:hypothetical protein
MRALAESYSMHRTYMSPIPAAILSTQTLRGKSHDGLARMFGELDYLLYDDSQKKE